MTWTKFFDGIYLINLPIRTERFMDSVEMLDRYNIPFERISAAKADTGQMGIRITMGKLFTKCLQEQKERILVFEDDAKMAATSARLDHWMEKVLRQLDGKKWDILSLGPNTHEPLESISENLLLMKKARGLHATAYSKTGMFKILELITSYNRNFDAHIDMLIEEMIQPDGFCFCTYPLLCTQRNGHSDIKNKEVNMEYIEQRFERNTRHLFPR